jgi:hypothetical protein
VNGYDLFDPKAQSHSNSGTISRTPLSTGVVQGFSPAFPPQALSGAPLMTRSVNGGFGNGPRHDQHRRGRAKALNYIFAAWSNFESFSGMGFKEAYL